MTLQPPDYVILAVALAGAISGLFIGVSGAIAFVAGMVAASTAGFFAYPFAKEAIANVWLREAAIILGGLLVLGLVRWLVKKFVHGLVAQPGDALLGALLSGVASFIAALGVVWFIRFLSGGSSLLDSVILEQVLVFLVK